MTLLVPLLLILAAALPSRRRPASIPLVVAVLAFALSLGVVVTGHASPLVAVVLLFATGLITVVAAFSRRHLDGDPHRARYDRWLLVTAGSALLTVISGDLALIATGWVLTGSGLTALAGHHRELPATARAVSALRRMRAAGDPAFLAGAAVLALSAGSTRLPDVITWSRENSASPVLLGAGAALLLAAAARCGLLPFSSWIPLSVVAPAPVSALLHAGIVNAPVILLIQLAPIWRPSAVLTGVLFAAGMLTALTTFPRLLVRADVKTRLAWSTTAQFGFVLVLVAAGADAAAVLHLLLHGVYKANAFLSAGEQLPKARRDRLPGTAVAVRIAGAVLGVSGALVLLALDSGWRHPLTSAAVLAASAAGGYGLMSLRAALPTRLVAAATGFLALAAVMAGARAAEGLLGLSLTADGPMAWVAAGLVLALALSSPLVLLRAPAAGWAFLHRLADPVSVRPRRFQRWWPWNRAHSLAPVPARPDLHELIREQVSAAARVVPPAWDWQSFVATNPLLGEADLPFAAAAAAGARHGWATLPGLEPAASPSTGSGHDRARASVDDLVAGWLAAWSSQGDAPWPAPGRDLGLWDWFRLISPCDPIFSRGSRRWLAGLPGSPLDLIAATAPHLDHGHLQEWAGQELLRLPGWAGYLSRRGMPAAGLDTGVLIELLAVRAASGTALGLPAVPTAEAGTTAATGTTSAGEIRLRLEELSEHEEQLSAGLLRQLSRPVPAGRNEGQHRERTAADLVFCIDVRSEPLRRQIEAIGPYRTAGFAGFFGMAVTRSYGHEPVQEPSQEPVQVVAEEPVQGPAAGPGQARFPVLLTAASQVRETGPAAGRVGDLLNAAVRRALDLPGGGFAAVDVAAVKGLVMSARVLWPSLARPHRTVPGRLDLQLDRQPELAQAAVGLIAATGLYGPRTAPIVILVGHGSTSSNNPAEAAFDCGACGGRRGGFNARVAAQVLNHPLTRARLAAEGLPVPADTVFVAAEHDTALDRVVLLDAPPAAAPEAVEAPGALGAMGAPGLAAVMADLAVAGAATAIERCAALPGAQRAGSSPSRARRHVRRRALDASEVRHEWGLAGNAFFIAGPRELTKGLDLGGRAFLHEYDAARDPNGAALESILTAPLVVAHWINAQYFFSACDPERLGAGSKTAHNPVGAVGVLSGPGGDLRTGLSEQSVRYLGEPVHRPVRLFAVVAASTSAIDRVLARHPQIEHLVTGQWLNLCALDPITGQPSQRVATGWLVPESGHDRLLDREALDPRSELTSAVQ